MPVKIQQAYIKQKKIEPQKYCPTPDQNQNTKCTEKNKNKICKRKMQSYIRITSDFSVETQKARAAWKQVLQNIKGPHIPAQKILHPMKLSIILEGEAMIFHDKLKPKYCLSTNLFLQKELQRKLHPMEVNYS